MSNKFSAIALGTMLGLSTVAFSGASASAAAMLPLSAVTSGDAQGASGGIIQVDHKKWHKKKKWSSNNWNNNHNWKYRKHRRGYDSGVYLSLPLILGGAYAANRYYGDDYYDYDDYDDYGYDDGGGLSSQHVRYCLNKYKSYKPRNNTWVTYGGQVKKCYSPYM
ncbi:MAG: BA14K family protein [Aestuariivirga sp.]|nr:BA14K family protein [Aestuariivirga sp.]